MINLTWFRLNCDTQSLNLSISDHDPTREDLDDDYSINSDDLDQIFDTSDEKQPDSSNKTESLLSTVLKAKKGSKSTGIWYTQ